MTVKLRKRKIRCHKMHTLKIIDIKYIYLLVTGPGLIDDWEMILFVIGVKLLLTYWLSKEKICQMLYELNFERVDIENINLLVTAPGLVGVEVFPFLLVLALSHGTVFFLLLLFLPH